MDKRKRCKQETNLEKQVDEVDRFWKGPSRRRGIREG